MSTAPRLRSLPDRLRQIALFEAGGLLLITPPFVWLSGQPALPSLGLLAILALIAAVWNGLFNTAFDWADDLPVLGTVPTAAAFKQGAALGKPVYEIAKNGKAAQAIENILNELEEVL